MLGSSRHVDPLAYNIATLGLHDTADPWIRMGMRIDRRRSGSVQQIDRVRID